MITYPKATFWVISTYFLLRTPKYYQHGNFSPLIFYKKVFQSVRRLSFPLPRSCFLLFSKAQTTVGLQFDDDRPIKQIPDVYIVLSRGRQITGFLKEMHLHDDRDSWHEIDPWPSSCRKTTLPNIEMSLILRQERMDHLCSQAGMDWRPFKRRKAKPRLPPLVVHVPGPEAASRNFRNWNSIISTLLCGNIEARLLCCWRFCDRRVLRNSSLTLTAANFSFETFLAIKTRRIQRFWTEI